MTSPIRPRRRRRRLVLVGLAVLTSLGILLVALELTLRIVDPAPHPTESLRGFYRLDAEGRIETAPGWRGLQPVDGRTIEVRTNALGLRGPEVPPKAARERRVLLVGDSFVWGMGVTEEETIPAALEQQLLLRGAVARVGNAGMYGTSMREWGYTTARLLGTFQPDLVVAVCYLGNDISDLLLPALNVLDGYLLAGAFAHAARESWRWNLGLRYRTWFYLERWLNQHWPIAVPPAPQLLPPGVSAQEGVFLDLEPDYDAEAPWLRTVEALLRDHLRALRDAAGAVPCLVVLLPSHEVVLRPYEPLVAAAVPGAPAGRFRRGNGGRRLQRLCADLRLPCRDLDAEFAAHAAPDTQFLATDWHLSPAGCAQVAAWIVEDVERLLFR